jgi:hypothetical protein
MTQVDRDDAGSDERARRQLRMLHRVSPMPAEHASRLLRQPVMQDLQRRDKHSAVIHMRARHAVAACTDGGGG